MYDVANYLHMSLIRFERESCLALKENAIDFLIVMLE